MLTRLGARQLKGYTIKPVGARFMSTAAIRDRFHEAWLENASKKQSKHVSPDNKEEYGAGYYQRRYKGLKKGYQHPYHSEKNPLSVFKAAQYVATHEALAGPEQVSPHFESLSRSRRGLILLAAYLGTITTTSKLGGWDHNEWIRGMVFHHEFLIALWIGYAELRHFTWLPGPKFTIFYDVYTRYELGQLASQWNDTAEEISTQHYQNSRTQVDFMGIHNEYKFIKKRAMVNYLSNERLNLEKHFHDRTVNMLKNISSLEAQNLKNKVNAVTKEAVDATMAKVDRDQDGEITEQAFQAALDGLRKGKMDYAKDPVLPILQEEISSRVADMRSMTAQEESDLLSLNSDQRRSVAQADRAAKDGYLSAAPHVSSQGLKSHSKFQRFVDSLTNTK